MPKPATSFAVFAKRYQRFRATKVRYASKKQIDAIVNTHLAEMKDRPVKDVFTRCYLAKWRKSLYKNKELSIGYRNRMISALQSMAKQAHIWGYISVKNYRDAVAVLETFGSEAKKKKERAIYTKEEIQRFLQAIPESDDRLMFDLFSYLGCRIGEFLGLTWDCFHEEGTIEIKQQCSYEGKGAWILTPVLKTNESYRVCPLPKRLIDQLVAYRLPGRGRRFIFSLKKDHRSPYGESTFRKRLDEYALKAGLPRLTPHCFRHSKATMLLEVCNSMEEVKSAARFLGHSATMLLDTYGHAKEETMNAILSRLE